MRHVLSQGRVPAYGAAAVFELADHNAKVLAHWYRGDAFSVLASGREFQQVRLASGATGFVYANNLPRSFVPATPTSR
jgi:hypothetical protein